MEEDSFQQTGVEQLDTTGQKYFIDLNIGHENVQLFEEIQKKINKT